ncbi:protein boule-like [Mastacembelus armatus]|uniref:protein boule-like n=1 Tax=Mastacembelus armatus TaxID=205130 RepID=UPI000E45E46C|nr:protein boule-like [Mastacembelus armatus]
MVRADEVIHGPIESEQGSGRLGAQSRGGTCNRNGSSFSIPEVLPAENRADSLSHHISHFGTVIPKRIFVGGLDEKVSESELQQVFSLYGAVKDVKIVVDRLGLSKGYGFVTFETQEDVLKILRDGNGIYFKDKKLNIGPAVRKRQGPRYIRSVHFASPGPAFPLPMSSGDLRLTTATSYPYTHQSGLAYFYCNNMHPPAHSRWPPASSVMHLQTPQPVYQQPAYHPYQYLPNPYQWDGFQPMPSNPIRSSQQSEYRSANVQPPQHGTPNTENLMFPYPQVHLEPKSH